MQVPTLSRRSCDNRGHHDPVVGSKVVGCRGRGCDLLATGSTEPRIRHMPPGDELLYLASDDVAGNGEPDALCPLDNRVDADDLSLIIQCIPSRQRE